MQVGLKETSDKAVTGRVFGILGHVLSNWCCLTSEHASDESVNKEVKSAFDDRIKDGITVFIEE